MEADDQLFICLSSSNGTNHIFVWEDNLNCEGVGIERAPAKTLHSVCMLKHRSLLQTCITAAHLDVVRQNPTSPGELLIQTYTSANELALYLLSEDTSASGCRVLAPEEIKKTNLNLVSAQEIVFRQKIL